MKKWWWIIILVISGLILGPRIKGLDGFIVVVIDKTTSQFPLWLGVLMVFLLVVLFHILIGFMVKSITMVIQAKGWSGSRHWKKARENTISGMLAFTEGRWDKSEKNMIAAAKKGDTKLINFLVAAESAQNQGKYKKRDEYLVKAKILASEENFAIELTQARLQLESEQYEAAFQNLIKLSKKEPQNIYILKLFCMVCSKLKDWDNVIITISNLKKNKMGSSKKIETILEEAVIEKIKILQKEKNLAEIEMFWKTIPKEIQNKTEVLNCYVVALLVYKQDKKAETILKKQLKKSNNIASIKLFSKVKSDQPGKQLDIIESKIENNFDKVKIIEILIELSIKLKLWGKAKKFLKESLAITSSTDKQIQLAGVLSQLGEQEAARKLKADLLKMSPE